MLNEREQLNAVAWKAKKEGISYGQYSAILLEEEKKQIYQEYEQYLKMKEEEELKLRKQERKPTKTNKLKNDLIQTCISL